MAKFPEKMVCPECEVASYVTIKRTYAGFQKFKCTSCHEEITLPLTATYRMIYRIIAVMYISRFLYLLASDVTLLLKYLAGIFVLISILYILYVDYNLRHRQ